MSPIQPCVPLGPGNSGITPTAANILLGVPPMYLSSKVLFRLPTKTKSWDFTSFSNRFLWLLWCLLANQCFYGQPKDKQTKSHSNLLNWPLWLTFRTLHTILLPLMFLCYIILILTSLLLGSLSFQCGQGISILSSYTCIEDLYLM